MPTIKPGRFTGFRPFPPSTGYFLIFLFSNGLLAYGHLDLQLKLWIGLMGVVVPLALAFLTVGSGAKGEKLFQEKIFQVPLGLGAVALGVGVFLRFYGWTSLPVWPMWDDASNAFFGIQQMRNWHWDLSYTSESIPPLFYWCEGALFRVFTPSLLAVWILPAIVSLLTWGAGYWAARQYFTGSLAFLCYLILAFSFWPLYLGQFDLAVTFVLLWELLAIGSLGRFWGIRGKKELEVGAVVLGLIVGMGFYTVILAVVPIFLMSLAVLAICWSQKPKAWKPFIFYLLSVLALLVPLAAQFSENILKGHVHAYLMVGGGVSDPVGQLRNSLSYLTAPLWGTLDKSYFDFGPFWGGLYNPILGSFIFLGLLEIWRQKGKKFFLVLVGVLTGLMLPGLVSRTLEIMRIVTVLPFCVFLAAVGGQSLIRSFSLPKRTWVLFFFLLCSLSLDVYHLIGPYHLWATPGAHSEESKSPQRYRAFQVLEQVQAKEGPGIIFTEFVSNIFDQSLLVTTYLFNAAANPKLNPEKTRWAAVLADDSFRPYFVHHFSRVQIYPLWGGLPNGEGDLVLFLLPLDPKLDPVVQSWLKAHRSIQDLFGLMPYHVTNPDYVPAIGNLESNEKFFKGDLFLESCYWEKLAYLEDQVPQYRAQANQTREKGIRACGLDPTLKRRAGYFWEKSAENLEDLQQDDKGAFLDFKHSLQANYASISLFQHLARLELRQKDYRRALWAVQEDEKLEPENPAPMRLALWLQRQLILDKNPGSAQSQR